MAYVTFAEAITVNGETWWVDSRKSGLISHAIKSMIEQVQAMLSHHNKVFILRFDLKVKKYSPDNKVITKFNRNFHKWLKLKPTYRLARVGFMWCREKATSDCQHYHYALMTDGNKINQSKNINSKIKQLLKTLPEFRAVYFPEHCYYNIKRHDYESIQDAIWRISYLAKPRTKGKCSRPPQTKDYGTSRIKPANR